MRRAAVVVAVMLGAQLESAQLTIVRGRVLADDDAAAAIRGARIDLIGTTAVAAPVFTDGEGRFALGLPESFTLKVTKAGYAPAIVQGRALAARSADLRVRLGRGAVISGHVDDQRGAPVAGAGIRARRLDPTKDEAAAGLIEFTAETDDLGDFRVGSLPPGRYSVHSEPRNPVSDHLTHFFLSEVDILRMANLKQAMAARPLPPGSDAAVVNARAGDQAHVVLAHRLSNVLPADAAIGGMVTGSIVDEFGEPLEGVTVRAWRLRHVDGSLLAQPESTQRRTDDRGQYRLFYVPPGRYVIVASIDDETFAPMFLPGTAAIANASPVTVARRQETPGAHMTFSRTREARVSGVARDAKGGPLNGTVTLTASRRSGAMALPPRVTAVAADGGFEFLHVPPGDYVLRAAPGFTGMGVQELAVQFIRAGGADLDSLAIRTLPTATLAGRISVEGRLEPPSPFDFRLVALPEPDFAPFGARRPTTMIRGDALEIQGLLGPTRFAIVDAPTGWWLKRVDIRGVNAAEVAVPFDTVEDSRHDVDVVIATTGATIGGRVADDAGKPVEDYRVVVFSSRRELWFPESPYVRMTGGPDADGAFSVFSVPPGDYFVAALEALDGDGATGEWQNVDFLTGLASIATRVTAGERQRVTADLRVVKR